MVEPDAIFYKPNGFDDRLGEVQRRIEELNLRGRNNATPNGVPQMPSGYPVEYKE